MFPKINFFPHRAKKAVTKVVESLAENSAPEVKKVFNYMKPKESLIGLKHYDLNFKRNLREDIYQNNNLVKDLKEASAPDKIIAHARSKFPLKYDKSSSVPEVYAKNSDRIVKKHNESEIQKLLKKQNEDRIKSEQVLNSLKRDNSNFSFADAKINNPDEILSLMKSKDYCTGIETQMIEELAKTGNESHAQEIISGVDNVIGRIAKGAKEESMQMSIYADSSNLAARLKAICKIGNENQNAEIIDKLKLELSANQNRNFAEKVYSAIGRVGKEEPNNTKYAEILLDQLFSKNAKSVYPELANFEGQFHILTKGMMENPDNTKILAAAYRSAKTPVQKQILLREILGSETLTDTAIRSTTEFYDINTNKRFVADVLSEITNKKQASLTSWQSGYLKSIMSS